MPRQKGVVIENKFIRGLVTENTALSFPKDACTETWNCVFDYTGRVTRRKGLDLETGYTTTNTVTLDGTEAWSDFNWINVSGDTSKSFYVLQIGNIVRFFDTTESTALGPNIETAYTLNLDDYIPSGGSSDPALVACQFTQGRGDLLITNQFIDPVLIQYDLSDNTFSATEIALKARDFEGVDDGLTLTERPTETIASLATNNPEHYYNILNQGWALTDALTQWDTARSDMPSNADMIGYYRGSSTDSFDDARVTSISPGNSPAIKGHFILDVGALDRTAVAAAEGFTLNVDGGSTIIDRTAGTVIGDYDVHPEDAFDNEDANLGTGEGAAIQGLYQASSYIGKDWGVGVTRLVQRALIKSMPGTAGYASAVDLTTPYTGGILFELYGSNTAPANATDGTLLGSLSIDNSDVTANSYEQIVYSGTTEYRYHWVRSFAEVGLIWFMNELGFSVPGTTFKRPRACSFLAGRAWYAGVDSLSEASNIYFSQIIQTTDQYGKCYQKNDPTSEEIADLLDDDGGVVRIPEIGRVERLFPFQGQMLVIASNGVWVIKGGAGGFKATDYQVKRITNIGSFSPQSFADVQGIPVWWGEDNIYTVTYDPNYDSVAAKPLTENVIQNFFQAIPSTNRGFVKATYDRLEDVVYWLYNDTEDLDTEDRYTYNRVLCFNTKTSAFYPWSLSTDNPSDVRVHGVTYIQDGERGEIFLVKFPITYTIDGTTYLSFADLNGNDYHDWTTVAELSEDEDDRVDFESYFITGYKINAELLRFFQTMYVSLFLEDEDNASVFVQGLWDFSNNSQSGKWSTTQQCYNMLGTKGNQYKAVRHRRLKMRGKGKALQLKVTSDSGKPFTLIGWASMDTANADI